jgi:hypothetical protein
MFKKFGKFGFQILMKLKSHQSSFSCLCRIATLVRVYRQMRTWNWSTRVLSTLLARGSFRLCVSAERQKQNHLKILCITLVLGRLESICRMLSCFLALSEPNQYSV